MPKNLECLNRQRDGIIDYCTKNGISFDIHFNKETKLGNIQITVNYRNAWVRNAMLKLCQNLLIDEGDFFDRDNRKTFVFYLRDYSKGD